MPNLRMAGAIAAALLAVIAALATDAEPGANHIANADFRQAAPGGKSPQGFELAGAATYGPLGDAKPNAGTRGVRFESKRDVGGSTASGSLTTTVRGLTAADGRWFRLRVRALAQAGFAVEEDDLWLKAEFFRDQGKTTLDHVDKRIFQQVVRDRQALVDAGTNKQLGIATWRWFDLEFRTPFPEVDTVILAIGFGHGNGAARDSEFWIDEVELASVPAPADYSPPAGVPLTLTRAALPKLAPLGGRWYYLPAAGETAPPAQFNHTNADRLFYLSDRLEAPFAGNTSAWLRAGFKDTDGKTATEDRFVPDNLVLTFTPTHLVVRSQNLPNHPTAQFPDRERLLDGSPNYIQQQNSTYRIPLEPKVNPAHVAMKNQTNADGALPPGPIGVAINGVVFFNPFDRSQSEDAMWRLDRCCGHPAPDFMYHYHKYPACVKSPWSDDGAGHSPLIGFAFDGFPVFGPYESTGELAKNSTSNPLNEFNVHQDPERGWHYHVTPGAFPHIIGGYWGQVDAGGRRGPPPGGREKGPRGPEKGKGKGPDKGPGKGPPDRRGPPPER